MSAGSAEARRYLLRGRVQGVGFRYFVQRQAEMLKLDGWVRNLPDGRVEAVAAGGRELLELLERQLRRGPAGAEVADIDVTPAEPAADKGFAIRQSG